MARVVGLGSNPASVERPSANDLTVLSLSESGKVLPLRGLLVEKMKFCTRARTCLEYSVKCLIHSISGHYHHKRYFLVYQKNMDLSGELLVQKADKAKQKQDRFFSEPAYEGPKVQNELTG